jgi:sulfoxide reductase heme-binding subunit YedZ
MNALKAILNHRAFFWTLLALPSLPMVAGLLSGAVPAGELLHESGEFSARFMIIALMITPFVVLFPARRWPRWLLARRRYLGVAAFAYAGLHTIAYLIDKGALQIVVGDLAKTGIWTGWIAFLVFVPLALTSNDWSVRRMGPAWKTLQRAVYVAALFTVAHWVFLEYEMAPALVHFVPLAVLETLRVIKQGNRSRARRDPVTP